LSLGFILLIVATLLIVFGVGQRVLDRMRLSDRMALLFIAGIFIGSLIPDIHLGSNFYINIGGAVIPIILSVYLFIKAGTAKEKIRAVAAAIAGGLIVFFGSWILPEEPENMVFDPTYIFGILAGLAAYIMGRSRRSAFIGGMMGVLLADLAQGIVNRAQGINNPIRFGGAGAMDAVILAGFIAVLLADLVGELRERFSKHKKEETLEYHDGEFMHKRGT